MSKLNLKNFTLVSTFALAALAAAPGNASAHDGHGTSQHQPQGRGRDNDRGDRRNDNDRDRNDRRYDRDRDDRQQHAVFHREEAARRAEQDRERRERADRRMVRYQNERRVALRQFGARSPEYRAFVLRWERRWNDYLAGEKRTMVQQRMAARARHETYHLRVADYDYLRVDDDCIQRELVRSGVRSFPHEETTYGYDNRGREQGRRDDRRNVDWTIGVRVGS